MIISIGEHFYDYVYMQLYNSSDSLVYTAECTKNGQFYEHDIPVQAQGIYNLVVRNSDDLVLGLDHVYSDGVTCFSETDLYGIIYFQLFFKFPLIPPSVPKSFILYHGIEKGVTEHLDGGLNVKNSFVDLNMRWDNISFIQRNIIIDFYDRVSQVTYAPEKEPVYVFRPESIHETQNIETYTIEIKGTAVRV